MEEKEGIIAISDPKWEKVLLVEETELEGIITYLNSNITKLTPTKGFQYIKKFAVGIVDQRDYEQDFKQHILPFQDLIPLPQYINPEKYKKAYTCSRSCSIKFLDFSNKPDDKYEHIMIFQDIDTKFSILRPLPSLDDYAIYICLIEIFSLIGVPSKIITSAEARIKPLLEKLSYFCENFDSKVELPYDSDEEDLQKFKDLVEEWMATNNSSEWHIGLSFIQFRHNCDYDPITNVSPFDMLFKPKYEYVKRKFTRYLLHRPKVMETPTIHKAIDVPNLKEVGSLEKKENSNGRENINQEKGNGNEFYLVVKPGNNQLESQFENHETVMNILENTNIYRLSDKNKDPIVEGTDNRHIVLYKKSNYFEMPTTETMVKLEPINIKKLNNGTDWVCKVREVDSVNNTEYPSDNKQNKELYELQSEPSSNYSDPTSKVEETQKENSLVQTIRNELTNFPVNSSTTICLVCRKRKINDSQQLNYSQIGKPVRLRTKILDRQKGHPNFILAVIIDIMPNGEYKLGTPKGVLKDLYSSDDLMDCNHTLFSLDDIPKNKLIDITEALNDQLKIPEKELMKCTCYRKYGYCNPKFSFHHRCLMNENHPTPFRTEKPKEIL